MNVRRAQLDGVPQNLIHEANDRGIFRRAVEVGVFELILVHHLERLLFVERADGVRAHAQALLHLALDRLRWRQHGTQAQARHTLERVEPLGRKEPAGGHLHRAIHAAERQQLILQQNARGEQREDFLVRLDIFQRSEREAVLLGEPAEHILLRPNRRVADAFGVPLQ